MAARLFLPPIVVALLVVAADRVGFRDAQSSEDRAESQGSLTLTHAGGAHEDCREGPAARARTFETGSLQIF